MDVATSWTLDEASKDLIRRACIRLAQVCDGATSDDGAGFNGADADFGHRLAGLKPEWWTPGRYHAAYKMLRKYRNQLSLLGVDYGAISEPANPAASAPLPEQRPRTADDVRMVFTGTPAEVVAQMQAITTVAPVAPLAPTSAPRKPSYTTRDILGPGGVISQQLPGYEHRESQIEMAELIERGMDAGTNVVCEAGTGTGKSLGYLIPAILRTSGYASDDPGRPRTIVSTADKALQSQLWLKDIPFLHSVMPIPFTAALLKGKSNYLCLEHLNSARERMKSPGFEGFGSMDAGREFEQVWSWGTITQTGDLEELSFIPSAETRELVVTDSDGCVGQNCPFFESCWSEHAKRLADKADVVIVNHALFLRDLSLRAETGGHVSVLPDSHYAVLDEAHHLEDIATDAFGTELTSGGWVRIVRAMERLTTDHKAIKAKRATQGNSVMVEVNGEMVDAGTMDAELGQADRWMRSAEALTMRIDRVFDAIATRMEKNRETTAILGDESALLDGDPSTRAFFAMVADSMKESTPSWLTDKVERERWTKLAKQIEKYSDHLRDTLCVPPVFGLVVRYAELSTSGKHRRLVLHIKPIDVSEQLAEGLFANPSFASVIATSATIATEGAEPFSFWTSRVGCDEYESMIVASPFDYPHAALLYLPSKERALAFDPTSQKSPEQSLAYLDTMAAEIEQLILSSDGRAFVLFTSFRALDECYKRLSPRLSKYLVLRQGELPRPELVKQFREHGSAVLFGVKSFWEGVDVQGEALSMVIIDKLPFTPPDDPVWSARCDALNRQYQDRMAWFFRLAIPHVQIALKQGFGRLIRTRADRGVVAILDGRLTTKGYGTRVVNALPPATRTGSPDAVKAFFGH